MWDEHHSMTWHSGVSRIAWLVIVPYQFLYEGVCQEVWGHNVAFQGKLNVSVFREEVKKTIQNTLILLMPYVPSPIFIVFFFLMSFQIFIPFFPIISSSHFPFVTVSISAKLARFWGRSSRMFAVKWAYTKCHENMELIKLGFLKTKTKSGNFLDIKIQIYWRRQTEIRKIWIQALLFLLCL